MRSQVTKGLDKIQRRLTTADFVAKPSGPFLRDWSKALKEEVLNRVPRGTGDLARLIESSQDSKRFPLFARVFSESPKARWLEYGTGLLSEDPNSAKQRYFPPWSYGHLRDWSEAQGIDPYMAAWSIYEQGGTYPTHFFSDAERAADATMNSRISRFGRMIERQAGIEP